ncbi:Hypothetical protein LUCI_1600 [Lucifera butyrica]|uniref:Uncharacterized protein n=1 Tax=Lucifera butyrica TaxID=1351585 RepID=A0A498R5D9_9FIRM|nr:hypothetical protein [Lucifera butyrica]VBB06369.1 Hypothetical protein LUCI_1600 [Lucifera butyrica]
MRSYEILQRGGWILRSLLIVVLVTGCSRNPAQPVAGLTALKPEAAQQWGLPKYIKMEGPGNEYRVLTHQRSGSGDGDWLELAAGEQGQIEYFQTVSAAGGEGIYRLQFLSTQGTGRIKVSALSAAGQEIGTVGWVYTGPLSPPDSATKWLDMRYQTNYQGGWLTARPNLAQIIAREWPQLDLKQVAAYRLAVEAGQGQHVMIARFKTKSPGIRLQPRQSAYATVLGDTVNLQTEVKNMTGQPIYRPVFTLMEPEGYGLVAKGQTSQTLDVLAPGEKRILTWKVKAQRPDLVNGGKPWLVHFTANGEALDGQIAVTVSDPRPGKIYYVMTEDLEPIDAAGYPKAWGNQDGWLEPQELYVQLVEKSEALNQIANKYGAKWTHYIAWTAIKAAEWAEGQSTSHEWTAMVTAMKKSVQTQSTYGHEYAVHLHSDYDPDLQGNFLSYNPAVDGFWANHLKHGWAHVVSAEGNFNDNNSRTGLLYKYKKILDKLEANSGQGDIITARAGSFDFGSGSADEAMSVRAYHKVGLWGSSDADGNNGGLTAGDYGREIYLTKPDDIDHSATDLSRTGLVEFRPTPRRFIAYDKDSAAAMNAKADAGMERFTDKGTVKPGVHAIIGFTHAMFVMGNGDWHSLSGGQFQAIQDHLHYLKEHYVKQGTLVFATASELVKAYLDYYTPRPVVVYGPIKSSGSGMTEYKLQVLGRDIPIDAGHAHAVTVKYPLYLRDSAYKISIQKNGKTIYSTWGLPTPFNDVAFTLNDGQAVYTMKVYHNRWIYRLVETLRDVKAKLLKIF